MKNKILLAISAALTLVTTSCEESYLDTAPTASIDASAAFATTKNAMAAMNGMYRALIVRYEGSQGHSGQPAMNIIMDVMGEDLVFGNASNGWHFGEQRWLSHRSETGTMAIFPYRMYYRIIGNANLLITNIDNAVGTQAERDALKGEAMALRGWAYFNLVQMYGKRYNAAARPNNQLGVPLILEPTKEGLPRNTVEEVYTQINKDLTDAIRLLPVARANKSRINQQVAKGILARVALTQQNWTLAEQMAAEARQGWPLMSQAQYLEGFAEINNPEWMWGFDHLEDQSEFFGGYHSYISSNFNSSVIRQTPKAINSLVYNRIPSTDIRSQMWVRTPTAANSIVPPGGVRVPFMVQKFRLPGTPSTSTMGDVPYMRTAEMILIQAEAQARQGKNAEAAATLFTLVRARDTAATQSTRTGADLIDEIMFNRRIELWGEGFRFLDLKRTNSPLNRNGANHNPAVAVLFDVPAGDNQWEFLIPRAELDANKAMVQNPL